MNDYTLSQIYLSDSRNQEKIRLLLEQEGIQRDRNLDYTCALFDANFNVVATGSCFGNTLRCLAVSSAHQGEGLMNQIITHLTEVQFQRGNRHLFLYTKAQSAKFFRDVGFYPIAETSNGVAFLENRRNGFSAYLETLRREKREAARVAAVVINANPFSLGHQYLIEKAANENEVVHIFIVSEETSLFPFPVRKCLVQEGTAHLKNVLYHDSGPYIISSATFPSYFQKDEESVIEGQALLDITIFKGIASVLGITHRYIGEEPKSQVTGIYNRIMKEKLPQFGIQCSEIPRKEADGKPISASTVRSLIKSKDFSGLANLVPQTTLSFLLSEKAAPVIAKIQATENVVHY